MLFTGIEFSGDAVGLTEDMAKEKRHTMSHHTAFVIATAVHLLNIKNVRTDLVGCDVPGRERIVILEDEAHLPQVIGNASMGIIAHRHYLL